MKARVLLLEDDIRLASSVINYLELNGIICDHCADGERGLELVEQNSYDVLVTDINMPRVSGLQVCQVLRERGLDLPIIMVTSRDALDDKIEGFEAGTDDYLVKPFELKELLLRVEALSTRRSGQSTAINIDELGLHLDLNSHSVIRDGQHIKLSKSGWALLELLARSWPNPVSKADLEHALWGDEPPDSNGLKVHVHNLRQRIDKPFERPIVQTVQAFGFVLSEKA